MAGENFEFTDADVVSVGTVGEPGRRVFLLQVVVADTITTLKLEKHQVGALSTAIMERLQDLPARGALPTALDLRESAEVVWGVGAMGLGYLDALDRLVLDAVEAVPVNEAGDPTEPQGALRVLLTREQGQALAIRAADLVEARRPPCPRCNPPLAPRGQAGPKKNGKRAPDRRASGRGAG